MAGTRNIVGDFRFEQAAGKRQCDVSAKHVINAGDLHFAYEKVPGQRKNICMSCAPKILQVAQEHLAGLMQKLS